MSEEEEEGEEEGQEGQEEEETGKQLGVDRENTSLAEKLKRTPSEGVEPWGEAAAQLRGGGGDGGGGGFLVGQSVQIPVLDIMETMTVHRHMQAVEG